MSEVLSKTTTPIIFSMQSLAEISSQGGNVTDVMQTMVKNLSMLRTTDQQQTFRPLVSTTVHHWSVLGWTWPSSCRGLVSRGHCPWSSDDIPDAEDRSQMEQSSGIRQDELVATLAAQWSQQQQ